MFFHDAIGILFLVVTGSFLLFLPLATAGLLVVATQKAWVAVKAGTAKARKPELSEIPYLSKWD